MEYPVLWLTDTVRCDYHKSPIPTKFCGTYINPTSDDNDYYHYTYFVSSVLQPFTACPGLTKIMSMLVLPGNNLLQSASDLHDRYIKLKYFLYRNAPYIDIDSTMCSSYIQNTLIKCTLIVQAHILQLLLYCDHNSVPSDLNHLMPTQHSAFKVNMLWSHCYLNP